MHPQVYLPILGIAIVLFCILSFILPYGERLKDRTQKIKGLGLELEVSVVTLLIIVGALLSGSAMYPQIAGINSQLSELNKRLSSANSELDRLRSSQTVPVDVLVEMEGIDAANVRDLQAFDVLALKKDGSPFQTDRLFGSGNSALTIRFREVRLDAPQCARLEVVDQASQEKWLDTDVELLPKTNIKLKKLKKVS